jgi:hypothetical protein
VEEDDWDVMVSAGDCGTADDCGPADERETIEMPPGDILLGMSSLGIPEDAALNCSEDEPLIDGTFTLLVLSCCSSPV